MGRGNCQVHGQTRAVRLCSVIDEHSKLMATLLPFRLKRAFVLIDSEHGVKANDEQILEILADNNIPFQLILSKVDKLLSPKMKFPLSPENLAMVQDRVYGACHMVEERVRKVTGNHSRSQIMLACAAGAKLKNDQRLGIDGVRWAVLDACRRLQDTKETP
jgi:GTP-binding protein